MKIQTNLLVEIQHEAIYYYGNWESIVSIVNLFLLVFSFLSISWIPIGILFVYVFVNLS